MFLPDFLLFSCYDSYAFFSYCFTLDVPVREVSCVSAKALSIPKVFKSQAVL